MNVIIEKNENLIEFKLKDSIIKMICEPKDLFNISKILIKEFSVVEIRYFNCESNNWSEYEKFCKKD